MPIKIVVKVKQLQEVGLTGEIKKLLEHGVESFNRGELNKASKIFNEIIETANPSKEKAQLIQAYFHIANIFHQKGEIGKAIKAFNRVLTLDPSHTDASISLSVLYNDIGHYESAKKIFDKTSSRVTQNEGKDSDSHINKKFSEKHLELAELYMTYNRLDEALFEYNKANGLDSQNLEIRVKIAKVYAKKNFLNKAFDELKKLKNEHPEYDHARISLGILYYGNGQILEAQSEWERVLSKDPSNEQAGLYLNLAKTAIESSRPQPLS